MVAVDGVLLDPNRSRASHIYKRVRGKFTQALSKLPIWGEFSQMLSKTWAQVKFAQVLTHVKFWGNALNMLPNLSRKRRVRKWNALGEVVGFVAQEVRDYPEDESLPDNNEDVAESHSSGAV